MAKSSKDELVTKGMIDQAIEAILKGMDKLFGGLRAEINSKFERVESRLDRVETDTTFIKRDIGDIKVELSDAPSRREFTQLKEKVDKVHPLA